MARIDEIERRWAFDGDSRQDDEDGRWLIARVRKLEAVVENCELEWPVSHARICECDSCEQRAKLRNALREDDNADLR